MNLLEIIQQDPQLKLARKIESYGRDIIVDKGIELVNNHFGNELSGFDYIVDFKDDKDLGQGCLTYYQGREYPERICLQDDRSVNLHRAKKIIPTILTTVRYPIDLIYFWFNWKYYLEYIHFSFKDLVYPDVKYYSQPVRELYRLMSDKGEVWNKIRDILCTIIEGDTAYRYPFQIIGEYINNSDNSLKEIIKILQFASKEFSGLFEAKIGSMYKFVYIYLMINRKLLRQLEDMIKNLNKEEVKRTSEDLYWSKIRWGK